MTKQKRDFACIEPCAQLTDQLAALANLAVGLEWDQNAALRRFVGPIVVSIVGKFYKQGTSDANFSRSSTIGAALS